MSNETTHYKWSNTIKGIVLASVLALFGGLYFTSVLSDEALLAGKEGEAVMLSFITMLGMAATAVIVVAFSIIFLAFSPSSKHAKWMRTAIPSFNE